MLLADAKSQHAAMLRSLLWGSRVLLLLLALALVPTDADGKFFAFKAAPGTPFQQALLIHQDGVETLVLQSAWKSEKSLEKLLWIVPVPAVPEIGGMGILESQELFRQFLTYKGAPKTASWVGEILGVSLAILWIPLLVFLLYMRFVSSKPGKEPPVTGRFLMIRRWLLYRRRQWYGSGLICYVLITVFFLLFIPTLSTAGPPPAPWVVSSGTTGAYDYQVVEATDAPTLQNWFQERGYPVSKEDAPILQDYLSRGWRFVALKMTDDAIAPEGMAPPVVLRFPSSDPVYPLALTATNGLATQILLFCLSDRRLDAQGRLPCMRAMDLGPWTKRTTERFERFFTTANYERADIKLLPLPPKPFPTYLTTFWGTMKPQDMQKDLILRPAPTNEEYQATLWRFW